MKSPLASSRSHTVIIPEKFLEQWPDLYAQYVKEQKYRALNVA